MGDKIKILLHHDYLKINVSGDDDYKEEIFLPIRCAKIISDMYKLRSAKNERLDLLNYSNYEPKNPLYDITIFLMSNEYGSELSNYYHDTIKPYTKKDFKELNKK